MKKEFNIFQNNYGNYILHLNFIDKLPKEHKIIGVVEICIDGAIGRMKLFQ